MPLGIAVVYMTWFIGFEVEDEGGPGLNVVESDFRP